MSWCSPILSHCPHTALNIFKFSESSSIAAFLPRESGKICFLAVVEHAGSDFPGGEGESRFLNRGGEEHIQGETGLRALGFKEFDVPIGAGEGEARAILKANQILFPEASV